MRGCPRGEADLGKKSGHTTESQEETETCKIYGQVGSCEGELRKFLFTSTYLLSDREGKVISNIK